MSDHDGQWAGGQPPQTTFRIIHIHWPPTPLSDGVGQSTLTLPPLFSDIQHSPCPMLRSLTLLFHQIFLTLSFFSSFSPFAAALQRLLYLPLLILVNFFVSYVRLLTRVPFGLLTQLHLPISYVTPSVPTTFVFNLPPPHQFLSIFSPLLLCSPCPLL